MKILSQTDEEMCLKDRGSGLYAISFIFLCVAAGFGAMSPEPLLKSLFLMSPFWIVGIGIILFTPTLSTVMNKTTGLVESKKKRFFIKLKDDDRVYQLTEVTGVIYMESWRRNRSQVKRSGIIFNERRTLYQQIAIKLTGGREVFVSFNKGATAIGIGPFSFMPHRNRERGHAEQIAAFLGVPLDAD